MTMITGITGGKGGTGKSTVATALAYELSKKNRVLLVDADADCPNDHLLLGIERKFLKNVEQRIPKWDLDKCTKCGLCGTVCKTKAVVSLSGREPIFIKEQCNGCGSCVIKCPVNAISWNMKTIGKIYTGKNHGIELLSGDLKANEPVSEFVVNELNEIIEKKKDEYDHIIIDTAAGTHCPVIAALEMCDTVFSVTEPTPLGKHDLEIILRLLKKLKVGSNIVVNRSDIGKRKLIEDLSSEYDSKIICDIPYSESIVSKYSAGLPIGLEDIPVLGNILKIIEDGNKGGR